VATESNYLIGHTLASCTLQRLIGRGGMGAVYLAQEARPRRTVAVKVLFPGLPLEPKVQAEFLTRFRREADAIAALDHINIMPVYEYGEQEELAFLVMPFVTGGTLRTLLEKRKLLQPGETLSIIDQAAAGLDYAHRHGIIHRDLKPGNILFHSDGRVLLADFGLAKILHETGEAEVELASALTSTGTVMGTPEYFSPEQSTGNPVDRRTDIYSLGVIVYHMLSGRVPFTGPTPVAIAVKHTIEDPPSLSLLNPAISPAVEAVVLKAMAKKPEQRYNSAGEFAQALRLAFTNVVPADAPTILQNDYGETLMQVSLASDATIAANPETPVFSEHEAQTIQSAQTPMSMPAPMPTPVLSSIPVSGGSNLNAIALPIREQSEKRRGYLSRWMAIIGAGLAIVIIAVGAVVFLHPGSSHSPASGSHVGSAGNHATATSTTAPTATQPVAKLPAAMISAGSLLYGTTLPACDANQSLWSNTASGKVSCVTGGVNISDKSSTNLAATFLNTFPNGKAIPNNYVLQVQVEQNPASNGNFGVLFRNQTGGNAQGAYSFFLEPNNHWEVIEYNNSGGTPSTIVSPIQTTNPVQGLMTIDIVVNGNNFTFYLNGQKQGNAISGNYPSGTIGLAADEGANVMFKNLAVYNLP
jgi:serine/threonine protein kinase